MIARRDAPAPGTGADDLRHRSEVRAMFAAITPRYDLANRVLSLGLDRRWRRRAVRAAGARPTDRVLDVCCGTGDLAFAFLDDPSFRGEVVGADFCDEMLAVARRKARRRPEAAAARVAFVSAEAERLPFPDHSFDRVVIAFGLRNLADPSAALSEFLRVTRPGGACVVLELAYPAAGVASAPYRLYFSRLLPWIGRLVSGHPTAYRYLHRSVVRFHGPGAVAAWMAQAGWDAGQGEVLAGGAAFVQRAAAPGPVPVRVATPRLAPAR